MAAVFLVYFTAAGGQVLAALPLRGPSCTYYLPNEAQDSKIDLAVGLDHEHSFLCLEIHASFVLLRAVGDKNKACSVLTQNGLEMQIPLSTSAHYKSLILRGDEHFFSPAGRWAIRWDDERGTISNSMRPPPLPVLSGFEAVSQNGDDLGDILHEERENCSEANSNRSSSSTCSPSPPPGKSEEETTACPEDPDPGQALLSIPKFPTATEDVTGPAGKHQSLVAQHENHSEEEMRPGLQTFAHPVDISEAVALSAAGQLEESAPSSNDAPSSRGSTASAPATPDSSGTLAVPAKDNPRKRKRVETEESTVEQGNLHIKPLTARENEPNNTILAMTTSRHKAIVMAHSSPEALVPVREVSPETPLKPTNQGQGGSASSRPRSREKRRALLLRSSPRRNLGRTPVVIFSNTNIQEQKTVIKSFTSLGGRITTSIKEATILVTGDGPLKKTGKLIMAVATGLDVVTEQWIVKTAGERQVQEPHEFLPRDPSREQEWGFNLEQAITRGKEGLTYLLAGTTVFFTKQLETDLGSLDRELSQIAKTLGAEAVKHRLPAVKDIGKYKETELLIIGAPHDPQGAHVGRLGQKLFNKDILTMGALRGEIDRESGEFIIETPVKTEETD